MYIVQTVIAEIKKEYKNNYLSNFSMCTALLWPILMLTTVYYTYASFDSVLLSENIPGNDILTYLLCGFMGYGFFRSMVSSAWGLSRERYSGVLEIIFMSPRNKLIYIFGRSLSSIIENTWLFIVFSIVLMFKRSQFHYSYIISYLGIYLLTLIVATIWGGLLNSLFLLSRDSTFLYNIFQQPMELVSGVRFPIELMSPIFGAISCVFPLSFLLRIIRDIIFSGYIEIMDLAILSLQQILIVAFTSIVVIYAEKKARKTGEFSLF